MKTTITERMIREAVRKETLKRQLLSPISEADAEFLAEWLIKEEEGGEDEPGAIETFFAGEGTTKADLRDIDMSTKLGKLTALAGLLEWLLDWIPNAYQDLTGQKEEEIGILVKGLRLVSRVVTGPAMIVLKAIRKIISMHPSQAEAPAEPAAEEPAALPVAAEGRAWSSDPDLQNLFEGFRKYQG